jgi:hypothetical protein
VVSAVIHGTYGSYQQELQYGEPCALCKKAAADYHRAWRKRKGPAQAHERWLSETRNLALERMVKEFPLLFEFLLTEVRKETPNPADLLRNPPEGTPW